MNTFLNDLYFTYARQDLPEPHQWSDHKAYDDLYDCLSPEGRAKLAKVIKAASMETQQAGEQAFINGLGFAISLFTGIFADC